MNTLTVSTPIGDLQLVSDGQSLVRIAFPGQHQQLGGDSTEDAILAKAAKQLGEFFNGRRRYFDLPLTASGTHFQREVWSQLTAIPFGDEHDAVRIANDIAYGLAGYVWTNDIGRGHRIAQNLDAGMIWVNSENNRHLPSPFGGMKASGIGRDGGDYSFEFYMETKNVCIAMGSHRVPTLGKS